MIRSHRVFTTIGTVKLVTLLTVAGCLATPSAVQAAKDNQPKPKLEPGELLIAEAPPFDPRKPILLIFRKLTVPGYNEWKYQDGSEFTVPEAKEYLLNSHFREVCEDCNQISASSEDLLVALSLPASACIEAVAEPKVCGVLAEAGVLGTLNTTSVFQETPQEALEALSNAGVQALLIDFDYSLVLSDSLTESPVLAAQLAGDLVPATATFEAHSLSDQLLFKAETKKKAIWRDRTSSTLRPILQDFSQWTCGRSW